MLLHTAVRRSLPLRALAKHRLPLVAAQNLHHKQSANMSQSRQAHQSVEPLFEISEYKSRIEKCKKKMVEDGIEVLILTDPCNMRYLTGYDAWSFYVHQAVVISLDHPEPIAILRKQDVFGAYATTWLNHDNIVGYADEYVHSLVGLHPMDAVVGELQSRGINSKRIGVEMDTYYFTAKCFTTLQKHLPDVKFSDATLLVNWLRVIKSSQEIEYIGRAASIVQRAMGVAMETIEPGKRQCDAVADIYHAQIAGTEQHGGDYPSIVPLLPTGDNSGAPHLTWTDENFKTGEATIVELGGCYRRYTCPMARTIYLGKPPQKFLDTEKIIVEGISAALDAARPGKTAHDVNAAWANVLSSSGIVKDSRIGYSTGVAYPPDWGEHTVSLRPNDPTEIRENMVFHLIPGIWLENWGIEISETFKVTADGGKPFCNFPRKLHVKE